MTLRNCPMKILIVYYQVRRSDRNTIDEHLYAFARYSGEECHYLNVFFGIPRYITRISFDLVVYHYTFTSLKWDGAPRFRAYLKKFGALKEIPGYKVAIPQDEYVNSSIMCEFFSEFGVKTVFTCLDPKDYEKIYPQVHSGLDHYITVLTGYIDERSIEKVVGFMKPHTDRAIDVGYRARKLPFWLGRHSLIKWQLTERFLEAYRETGNSIDLSNDYKDVFVGKDWYRFLGDCRVVLGCEGGASLHDPDGSIRACVEEYTTSHPEASFEEVERACFAGLDRNLDLYAISPRHFEACITKTCQALVEGHYAGIFKPGIHYIEIKKDWSNIEEVIQTIEDKALCEKIAERAYSDIILSGEFTYRRFVRSILNHVQTVHNITNERASNLARLFMALLDARERWPFLFSPLYFLMPLIYESRAYTCSRDSWFSFLKRHNLEDEYHELRHGHLGLTRGFFKSLIYFVKNTVLSSLTCRIRRKRH